MVDPFATLGLPPDAPLAEIRRAYRRLALRHHPDRNPGDPTASRRFQRVQRAYRAALAAHRVRPRVPAAPFACARCGDGFSVPGSCGRCGQRVHRRGDPAPVVAPDPRVEALLARLESRRPARELPAASLSGVLGLTLIAVFGIAWQAGERGFALLGTTVALVVIVAASAHLLAQLRAQGRRVWRL